MILGICGFAGSGKDTIANYLCDHHGFIKESYASTLKDVVSIVFSWERPLLNGDTVESREWRETVDVWWSERLGIPNLTPRYVLQKFGTELFRNSFHDQIWVASLQKRVLSYENSNVVISDCRFLNEIEQIRSVSGKVVRVVRGPEPDWIECAKKAVPNSIEEKSMELSGIHPSEWRWLSCDFDSVVDNNSDFPSLYENVEELIKTIK